MASNHCDLSMVGKAANDKEIYCHDSYHDPLAVGLNRELLHHHGLAVIVQLRSGGIGGGYWGRYLKLSGFVCKG